MLQFFYSGYSSSCKFLRSVSLEFHNERDRHCILSLSLNTCEQIKLSFQIRSSLKSLLSISIFQPSLLVLVAFSKANCFINLQGCGFEEYILQIRLIIENNLMILESSSEFLYYFLFFRVSILGVDLFFVWVETIQVINL